MEFQTLITGHITNHLNIIRKTYRWIALVCLIVFWSIFIKESTVTILGLHIEQEQISIVLYILITGTSLYVIERFRRISILVNQLTPNNRTNALYEVVTHDWLLNPFAYQQNIINLKEEGKTLSKFDFHINAMKLTIIPIIQIFMTLVLGTKQGDNMDADFNSWLIKCGYLMTIMVIISLLQKTAKKIDHSFIHINNKNIENIILLNQKYRHYYLKVLSSISIIVFIIIFYFGFSFIELFILMIKNIYHGNIEIVN